ncbi:MAG: urease accessory protein UreH domain-containing protein [Desulfitobacteriaceae bacterium]
MSKHSLSIEGMTCQSCVMKVSKAIFSVPGATAVNVSLSSQKASFTLSGQKTTIEEVLGAIEKAGYGASLDKKFDWFYVWGFLVLVILMMASNRLKSYEPSLSGASYGLLFIIGLFTSVHCVGMCGGITLSQVSGGQSFRIRSFSLAQYHLGRILSYTLVGAVLGGIGAFASPSERLRGILTVIGGLGMTLFALAGIAPQWFGKIRLPDFAAGRARAEGLFGHSSWGIGFINGFVPCGPLQGMQLFALASGSAWRGGLSMLVFSLGTIPILLGFGTFVTLLSAKFRSRLVKLGLLFVLLLGLMMVMRGMSFVMKGE